jgi:hypothetical protein
MDREVTVNRGFQGRIGRMKLKRFLVIAFITILGLCIGGTDQKTYASEAANDNKEVIYLTSLDFDATISHTVFNHLSVQDAKLHWRNYFVLQRIWD